MKWLDLFACGRRREHREGANGVKAVKNEITVRP